MSDIRVHRSPPSSRSRARGFTLIEAGVVLCIMGMLVVAVLPSIASWLRGLRVRAAAESVQNGLQRARVEALRRNQEVSFWLMTSANTDGCGDSASSGSWVVATGSASPSGACSSSTTVIESYALPATFSAVSVAATNGGTPVNGVTFNVFGQVKTGGTPLQKVAVTMPGYSDVRELDIDVTSGGLVRMCDPSVGKTDSRACPDAT